MPDTFIFKFFLNKFVSNLLNNYKFFSYKKLTLFKTNNIIFNFKRSLNFVQCLSNFKNSFLFIFFTKEDILNKNIFNFCDTLSIINTFTLGNGSLTNYRHRFLYQNFVPFPNATIFVDLNTMFWLLNEANRIRIPSIGFLDKNSILNFNNLSYFSFSNSFIKFEFNSYILLFILRCTLIGYKKRLLHFYKQIINKRVLIRHRKSLRSFRSSSLFLNKFYLFFRKYYIKHNLQRTRRRFRYFSKKKSMRKILNLKKYQLRNIYGKIPPFKSILKKIQRHFYDTLLNSIGSIRFWKKKRLALVIKERKRRFNKFNFFFNRKLKNKLLFKYLNIYYKLSYYNKKINNKFYIKAKKDFFKNLLFLNKLKKKNPRLRKVRLKFPKKVINTSFNFSQLGFSTLPSLISFYSKFNFQSKSKFQVKYKSNLKFNYNVNFLKKLYSINNNKAHLKLLFSNILLRYKLNKLKKKKNKVHPTISKIKFKNFNKNFKYVKKK